MKNKETLNKTNWKTTDNRFVAFIDILGFKDKVMRSTHAEIYEELEKISNLKKEIISVTSKLSNKDIGFANADIYIVNFSDSIVVFSKNDDADNFMFFLVAIRYLFAETIHKGIPLKGGIAHGEISINKSEQIYFGQAIIDAYLIEEDVNYFGIVAHNSIDKYLDKINLDSINTKRLSQFLFKSKSPLQCGNINHLNIDWFLMLFKDNKDFKNKVIDLLQKFNCTASGRPRKYVDNTIDFFESCLDKGLINTEKVS